MILPDLAATIAERGLILSARLVVDAPSGALTPELRGALAAHKALLLQRVVREMVWAELTTLRWGPAVDDPEPGIIIDRPDPADDSECAVDRAIAALDRRSAEISERLGVPEPEADRLAYGELKQQRGWN